MDEKIPAEQASAVESPTAVSVAVAAAPRSIGERLRAGRERAGLSLPAAAEKLHLDPKVIEALEADRFAELGASVYVRGHLRRYGDFVGEPGAELVSLYTARDQRAPPPDLTQAPQAERRSDPRRLVTPLAGLGCVLVLAIAIWWVLAGSQPGGTAASGSAQTSEATALPSAEASAVAASQSGAASPVQTASAPAAAAATPLPGALTATAEKNAAATESREETPVRPTQLRLELASESWVEVYDSRGARLYYDVASAGSVQSIEGRAPLRVVLGNAAAVAVQVNGQSRELPSGAAEGEGARFVVNRSGTLSRSRQ
jgi:cytoskeleton protein RodZ